MYIEEKLQRFNFLTYGEQFFRWPIFDFCVIVYLNRAGQFSSYSSKYLSWRALVRPIHQGIGRPPPITGLRPFLALAKAGRL